MTAVWSRQKVRLSVRASIDLSGLKEDSSEEEPKSDGYDPSVTFCQKPWKGFLCLQEHVNLMQTHAHCSFA